MVRKIITTFNGEDGNEKDMSPSIEASKVSLSKLKAFCSILGSYCVTVSRKNKAVYLSPTLNQIWEGLTRFESVCYECLE